MNSKSEMRGTTTSDVEVTNVSRHGLWIWLGGRELFLAFADFPSFADAPISKVTNVEWPSPDHLYWPDLDIDLSLQSIEDPARFPLRSRR